MYNKDALYKYFWMLIQVKFPCSNDAHCHNLACILKKLMFGSTDRIIQRAFICQENMDTI